MKISEKDFALLTSMVEFHFKFSEYIRETDKDLFYRAVDYAKTFAAKDGIQFNYWHEDNKKFLDQLHKIIIKTKTRFNRLLDRVGDEEKAKDLWMKKKNTNKDDVLGMNNYLANFKHHARELDYDSFDLTDWVNFANICKHVVDDDKFIEYAKSQVIRVLGPDSDILKEFNHDKN
jgi:hypothetical protein